jgi:hypothetical protein
MYISTPVFGVHTGFNPGGSLYPCGGFFELSVRAGRTAPSSDMLRRTR